MSSNVKILLVDDNPMVLGMLQQALNALGVVSTATDAADALLKAVEDPPDLMICDYRMPGMDGRQLLEKLKSRPATAGIAVILMASKADISDRLAQDPVEDYLEKFAGPPSAALTAIQHAARRRGLQKVPLRQINLAVKQVRQARRSSLGPAPTNREGN